MRKGDSLAKSGHTVVRSVRHCINADLSFCGCRRYNIQHVRSLRLFRRSLDRARVQSRPSRVAISDQLQRSAYAVGSGRSDCSRRRARGRIDALGPNTLMGEGHSAQVLHHQRHHRKAHRSSNLARPVEPRPTMYPPSDRLLRMTSAGRWQDQTAVLHHGERSTDFWLRRRMGPIKARRWHESGELRHHYHVGEQLYERNPQRQTTNDRISGTRRPRCMVEGHRRGRARCTQAVPRCASRGDVSQYAGERTQE